MGHVEGKLEKGRGGTVRGHWGTMGTEGRRSGKGMGDRERTSEDTKGCFGIEKESFRVAGKGSSESGDTGGVRTVGDSLGTSGASG